MRICENLSLDIFINNNLFLRTVSWNRDVPAEKLSFTMRREFDKHKEEVELIKQLRIVSLKWIQNVHVTKTNVILFYLDS